MIYIICEEKGMEKTKFKVNIYIDKLTIYKKITR